jgi:hypothetical protein
MSVSSFESLFSLRWCFSWNKFTYKRRMRIPTRGPTLELILTTGWTKYPLIHHIINFEIVGIDDRPIYIALDIHLKPHLNLS